MRSTCIVVATGLAFVASSAMANEPAPRDEGVRLIEAHVFGVLRPEDQEKVIQAGAYTPVRLEPEEQAGPATDAEYEVVRGIVDRRVFDSMRPAQRAMLQRIMFTHAVGRRPPQVCFTPGTDPEVVAAFERAMFPAMNMRFQLGPRWVSTASTPGPTGQGDKVTITYSFVPDGTDADGTPSNLFARMNAIYPGGPAVWQALYAQVFARWSELSAVDYVYEPNDDGVALGAASSAGALGVRGDVRLSGTPIDGNSGILAYNYYPDPSDGIGGDMVLDTNDNFYDNTTSNSLPLRNVLAHEHGHGLGFPHVCPNIGTKLMEPFLSTAFDGPQHDDILNIQRNYGDQMEPNESIAGAYIVAGSNATPQTITPISVDGVTDADHFRFPSVPAGSLLTITATPLGFRYSETFQAGGGAAGCVSPGTSIDPSSFRLLTINLRTAGGALLTSAAATLGSPATLRYAASSTADLLVEIAAGAPDNVQGYSLTHSVTPGSPAVGIHAPAPFVTVLNTGTGTGFTVAVTASAALSGSPTLFYRFSPSAAYTPVAMSAAGGVNWQGTIPAPACSSVPQFYFSATAGATTATLPPGAPGSVFTVAVHRTRITVFTDDFETNKGWGYGQPGDTAVTGVWQRGNPSASSAQPDLPNSGAACAVTGLGAPGDAAGVHDVDTGFTRLLSPQFNLASMRDIIIGYSRWYSNTGGAAPAADTFRVEVSTNDGGSWTPLETVGPLAPNTHGGWIAVALALPTGLIPSAQMRLRFTAEDADAGSLIEAALDDVSISGSATADFNGTGIISVQDLFDFLAAWFLTNLSADFNKANGVTVQDLFDFLKAYFGGC